MVGRWIKAMCIFLGSEVWHDSVGFNRNRFPGSVTRCSCWLPSSVAICPPLLRTRPSSDVDGGTDMRSDRYASGPGPCPLTCGPCGVGGPGLHHCSNGSVNSHFVVLRPPMLDVSGTNLNDSTPRLNLCGTKLSGLPPRPILCGTYVSESSRTRLSVNSSRVAPFPCFSQSASLFSLATDESHALIKAGRGKKKGGEEGASRGGR